MTPKLKEAVREIRMASIDMIIVLPAKRAWLSKSVYEGSGDSDAYANVLHSERCSLVFSRIEQQFKTVSWHGRNTRDTGPYVREG